MVAGSNGTKMPRGNKNFTMKYQVIIPNDIVMKRFSNIAQKINEQKQNLLKQSSILAHQRDLLLPRLMSGKLEVKV
jgi:type I restriction enzyme, S subunit